MRHWSLAIIRDGALVTEEAFNHEFPEEVPGLAELEERNANWKWFQSENGAANMLVILSEMGEEPTPEEGPAPLSPATLAEALKTRGHFLFPGLGFEKTVLAYIIDRLYQRGTLDLRTDYGKFVVGDNVFWMDNFSDLRPVFRVIMGGDLGPLHEGFPLSPQAYRWHLEEARIECLKHMIEGITDRPWGELAAELVFGPFDMRDTGYRSSRTRPKEAPIGAMWTTARDYAKFFMNCPRFTKGLAQDVGTFNIPMNNRLPEDGSLFMYLQIAWGCNSQNRETSFWTWTRGRTCEHYAVVSADLKWGAVLMSDGHLREGFGEAAVKAATKKPQPAFRYYINAEDLRDYEHRQPGAKEFYDQLGRRDVVDLSRYVGTYDLVSHEGVEDAAQRWIVYMADGFDFPAVKKQFVGKKPEGEFRDRGEPCLAEHEFLLPIDASSARTVKGDTVRFETVDGELLLRTKSECCYRRISTQAIEWAPPPEEVAHERRARASVLWAQAKRIKADAAYALELLEGTLKDEAYGSARLMPKEVCREHRIYPLYGHSAQVALLSDGMPSIEAIEAVMQYADGNLMVFVCEGDTFDEVFRRVFRE